jgi:hypothetical protein
MMFHQPAPEGDPAQAWERRRLQLHTQAHLDTANPVEIDLFSCKKRSGVSFFGKRM